MNNFVVLVIIKSSIKYNMDNFVVLVFIKSWFKYNIDTSVNVLKGKQNNTSCGAHIHSLCEQITCLTYLPVLLPHFKTKNVYCTMSQIMLHVKKKKKGYHQLNSNNNEKQIKLTNSDNKWKPTWNHSSCLTSPLLALAT